ncbi:MAG: hypothetical protein SFZ24_12035 [Planctomycetota bacterium]|nr:hypothetical protein [Planctomycetota bacterium]
MVLPAPSVLFTAFEPSGDDHAAAVIAELRRRHPSLPIYAWGGPKMERAGATLVQRTGDDAVVGMPGVEDVRRFLRTYRAIELWMRGARPTVHVPVDSPAANIHIAKLAKRNGAKVVHLVAPQLWAWGPWRIRTLRKRTDHVLCLLPFEEAWFEVRGVPATFVGHPLFDEPLDLQALDEEAAARTLPQGAQRLAILPGSRAKELRRNFPVMLEAFRELRRRHPDLVGVIGATTEEVRDRLRAKAEELGGWPDGLEILAGRTDLIVRWSTVAVAVSGTVTLQIAKQLRPMVVMYKINKLQWNAFGKRLIMTRFISLPNLIAGRPVISELFPYFKGHERLVEAVDALVSDPAAREAQRRGLLEVCERFAGRTASTRSADVIEEISGARRAAAAGRSADRRAAVGGERIVE